MQIDRRQRQPNQPPTGAPPNFVPSESKATAVGSSPAMTTQKSKTNQGPSVKAVDPGAIFPCMYSYVYIWPNYGRGFWAYVTYVGRRSIAGWRFNGRRWVYFGMDLRQIRSFYCY